MRSYKPEGATHYRDVGPDTYWYKKTPSALWFWWAAQNSWSLSANDFEDLRKHLKPVVSSCRLSNTGANQ